MGVRVVRLQLNGPLIVTNRQSGLAESTRDISETVIGLGVFIFRFADLYKAGTGLLVLLGITKSDPKIVLGPGKTRLQGEALAIGSDGFVKLPLLVEFVAALEMKGRRPQHLLLGGQDNVRQRTARALSFSPDGRTLVVGWDDGRVVVSTRAVTSKVKNLRRDPRISLLVMTNGYFGDDAWVQVEGHAEIVPLPEAMDALVDYYRRAAGEHENWDSYRAAMVRDERVVVRFSIERAGPN